MATAIEWAEETWNPVIGCSKVSPGCDNCYAIGQAVRIQRMGGKGGATYEGTTIDGDDWSGVVKCLPERLDQPLRWSKPRRVFVNSMSDLFHPDVPLDFILEVWSAMANAPQHTFQILTKRPQRMRYIVNSICWDGGIDGEPWRAYVAPGPMEDLETGEWWEPAEEDLDRPNGNGGEVPLENVWLGVSIESNRYAWRADHLRETNAAVRWVSAEPLLGPLDELDLTGIDWLVVGGESGPNHRPVDPDWVRDLRDRATKPGHNWHLTPGADDYRASDQLTAFLFKQWGGRTSKAGGRELDGRTWDEYPDDGDVASVLWDVTP